MPTPSIRFGPDCREPMQRGFDTLARLLALTLGPRGGNIVSQRIGSADCEHLSDGATIARRITDLPDRVGKGTSLEMLVGTGRQGGEVGNPRIRYEAAEELFDMRRCGGPDRRVAQLRDEVFGRPVIEPPG